MLEATDYRAELPAICSYVQHSSSLGGCGLQAAVKHENPNTAVRSQKPVARLQQPPVSILPPSFCTLRTGNKSEGGSSGEDVA